MVYSLTPGGKEDPYRDFQSVDKLKRGFSSGSTRTQEEYLQPLELQALPSYDEKKFANIDENSDRYQKVYSKYGKGKEQKYLNP